MSEDLLQAIATTLDAEHAEFMAEWAKAGHGEPDMNQVLARLFDYPTAAADISPVAVARATMAASITSNEDLDARMDEVQHCIQAWVDGLLIGLRYADQPPKPRGEVFGL